MKYFLATLFFIFLYIFSYSQCTLQNSTSCECADQTQSDCDLLPDITVSWQWTSQDYTEYPPGSGLQNGELNYIDNYFNITPEIEAMGRLRVGARTPNIGVGPLNLRGVDENGYRTMICNDSGVLDTFQIYDPNWSQSTYCPDGSNPKQIVWQRVYHKNSDGTMSYYEVEVGTMEYHPSHGHMHFDQWTIMTLRVPDLNNISNPLEWPIIGEGAKVGFCVMDLGNCSSVNAGCRDDETIYGEGNLLAQQDFPNYGLGGGSFGCSPLSQGISVGYNDTYGSYLDGMFMNIPLGTCNGNYAIVLEVPQNMLESNLDNNYTWVPITLTQQSECVTSYGCTDSLALNYDSLANTDDGSCEYLQCDFSIGDLSSISLNCSLDNDGQIFSTTPMQGGYPPYTVELFRDNISVFQQTTTSDFLNFQLLSEGDYTVLVEDSLACISLVNISVGVLNDCTPEIYTNDTILCVGDNLIIESSASNISPNSINNDDVHSDIIDIGFDFNFYGNDYSQLLISGNGFITFDLSYSGTYSPWQINNSIPNPGQLPENAIMAPWHDMDPSIAGEVNYVMFGNAPHRKFYISFDNVPLYGCANLTSTTSIVLHETSNVIDIYINNKPLCVDWNNGASILGLVNENSTSFHIVNDPNSLEPRNFPLNWSAEYEGWSFLPINSTEYEINNIPFNSYDFNEFDVFWIDENNNIFSLSSTFNFTADEPGNYVYYLCEQDDSTNSIGSVLDSIQISVPQQLQNCETFTNNLSVYSPSTQNECNGLVISNVSGGVPPYTYYLNGIQSDYVSNVCGGIYTMTVSDCSGCQITETFFAGIQILGCTDPDACNYNQEANVEDSSCVYNSNSITYVQSCDSVFIWNDLYITNSGVYDYVFEDSNGCDSTVQLFLEFQICGCMDPFAFNYNPLAITDDGSCELVILGCTDESAPNFNENANTDDGNCIECEFNINYYTVNPSSNLNCDGVIALTYDYEGDYTISMNGIELSTTFNTQACHGINSIFILQDNGCSLTDTLFLDANIIFGCTDPTAINYNTMANADDGSCEYEALDNPCDIIPSGLFVDNIIHNRVNFNWSQAEASPSHYMIRYRAVGTSSWTVMTAGPVNNNPYNGTSRTRYFMEPETTYEWNIRARVLNEGGSTNCQSSWSASSQFTTLPACPNLENLSVSTEANWVTLNADAPSEEWAVWQSKAKMKEMGTNSFRYANGDASGNINVLKGNFSPNSEYQWHTKAWCTGNVDELGNSDPQYHSGWGEFSYFTTEEICDKMPINLSTSSNGANTAITMSWGLPPSGTPDHYFLELNNDNTGQQWQWNNIAGSDNSKTKFGLTQGEYSWRIRGACGFNGTSWATIFSEPVYYTLGGSRLSSINKLNVYPNPSRDVFNVSFEVKQAQDLRLEVVNVLGEIILEENIESLDGRYFNSFDLSNQSNGIYFLKIYTNNGIISNKLTLQ